MAKCINSTIKRIITALTDKHLYSDPQYAKYYDGPEFPTHEEIDGFFDLCNVIMENFKCYDPLNKSQGSGFVKEEIKRDEVLELIN